MLYNPITTRNADFKHLWTKLIRNITPYTSNTVVTRYYRAKSKNFLILSSLTRRNIAVDDGWITNTLKSIFLMIHIQKHNQYRSELRTLKIIKTKQAWTKNRLCNTKRQKFWTRIKHSWIKAGIFQNLVNIEKNCRCVGRWRNLKKNEWRRFDFHGQSSIDNIIARARWKRYLSSNRK